MSGIMLNVVGGTFGIPIPAVGSAYGGGFFAGQISTSGNGIANYNLVIGPKASAQNTSKQFKTSNTGGDPTSAIDGPSNSATMNSAVYPAAEFCESLTIGGFSDWYCPAQNELEICYYNLKPSTNANYTGSGINANAVPARASNYTSGTPAQTSAADFQTGGVETFPLAVYWSSTQRSASYGWANYFTTGNQYTYRSKDSSRSVRAVRRVAIFPPLVIGEAYQGGFFAGQISTAGNGVADYNLVVGPVASAVSTVQWKIINTSTSGTSSVINGSANSAAMNDITHPAAQFCEGLTIGGFSDWYMPAKNELEVCYYNLKPTTTSNYTSSGINANAAPARASNYTAGTPAQTSAADFQVTGAEDFIAQLYWSSTEFSSTNAWGQYFGTGRQYSSYGKITYTKVRAIRKVPV
jgi:hypothetical protein